MMMSDTPNNTQKRERRDDLALERTLLANERTFLAYIRTALSLLAAGAVVFQFFATIWFSGVLAWSLIVSGGLILVIGVARFLAVKNKLGKTN